MADVISIPGGSKPWTTQLKAYTPALSDLSPSGVSGLPETWETLDNLMSCSTDWHSLLCPSISNHLSDLHLLHHPSSPPQTPDHPQKLPASMSSRHRLPGHLMSSGDDKSYVSFQLEDAHATVYSQSVSPFMARSNVNGTVSSSGSIYCDSDLGSFEHLDEPFTTRTAECHTGLVHPTPRNGLPMVSSNLPFLSSEETSFSSFGNPDTALDQQTLVASHPHVQDAYNYEMGQSFNSHQQTPPFSLSTASPDTKYVSHDQPAPWPVWKPEVVTDTWYSTPGPSGTSNDSSWQNQHSYIAPWSGDNILDAHSEQSHNGASSYGMSNGLPPQSGTPAFLPSSLLMAPQSYAPASVPQTVSIEVPHGYHLPSQAMYLPSDQKGYSDTEIKSPSQNHLSSLSPSSFTRSTTEEGPSPKQMGEERGGIEASMHYTDERNAFLIDCKRRGLSYKDIKRVGGFKEAESTLRGRYRTLTKAKEQRVRKPLWREKDIRLLCDAVTLHAETTNYTSMSMNEPPKVSWKKVAEYIQHNGGSYHFGNATCKKKWCDLHGINR